MTRFAQPVGDDERYLIELKNIILDASSGSARSRQKAIGPSEVGDPCARKLAYKMLDVAATNTATDPLPSIVGTGAHAWLADMFEAWNKENGRKRFWVEQRVVAGPIAGSCDLYDADKRLVIDHKFPGATGMKKYKTAGPSQVYRTQAHLYGLGHASAGRPVERVAIVFYPRGGTLGGTHMWSEPYNEQLAQQGIDRLMGIAAAIDMWMDASGRDVAATIANIPATVDYLCSYCPFLSYGSTDLSHGCPGEAIKENTHKKEGHAA